MIVTKIKNNEYQIKHLQYDCIIKFDLKKMKMYYNGVEFELIIKPEFTYKIYARPKYQIAINQSYTLIKEFDRACNSNDNNTTIHYFIQGLDKYIRARGGNKNANQE